ncbi:MAG: efflux RND transporter periplasmic adaptor subunit [Ruminococcaceae bacterium]|nr:efflux RND transporter periplasmic adaptor subunit [Oscillospiraceae bacterium]
MTATPRRILTLLLACVCIVSMLSGCYFLPSEEPLLAPPLKEPEAVDYKTHTVERGTIERWVSATGRFESENNELLQYTSVTGRLKDIYVRSGDEVKAGDLIAELDVGDLDYDIERQRANVRLAELSLTEAKATGRSATIERAEISLSLAQMDLDRLLKKQEEAQLRANMDGTVIYVANLEAGNQVSTYYPIVRIADTNALRIAFNTKDTSELYTGMELDVTYQGRNKKTVSGRIVQLPKDVPVTSSEEDKNSVKVTVDEYPDDVRIGNTVNIEILLERKEDVVILPLRYVSSYSTRRYVRVLGESGIPEERDVTLGVQNATHVEILSGLSEGDVIVI